MGTQNTTWPIAALAIPDPGLWDWQEVNTSDPLTSSYTEDAREPGVAVAPSGQVGRLVPVISGAQDVPVTLQVLRGGAPEVSEEGRGAELGYGIGTNAVVGWSPPNLVQHWEHVAWTTGTAYSRWDCATNTETQRAVVVYVEASVGATVYSRTWDPLIPVFGPPVSVVSGTTPDAIACADWAGSLFVLVHESTSSVVYRSDDDGGDWVFHADDPLPVTAAPNASSLAIGPTGAVYVTTDGTDLRQWVSHDGLSSFEEVDTIVGSHPRVVVLPDGTFVVSYLKGDNEPCVRRLSAAGARLSDADVVVVDPDPKTRQALAVDPDGLLWWLGTSTGAGHRLQVACSADSGATWALLLTEGPMVDATATALWQSMRATASGGAVLLAHSWTSAAGTGGSIGLAQLGGWGSVTSSPIYQFDGAAPHAIVNRSGSGYRVSSSGDVSRQTWLPIEEPTVCGWTGSGAGSAGWGTGVLGVDRRLFSMTFADQPDECAAIVSVAQIADASAVADATVVSVRSGQPSGGDFEVKVRVGPVGIAVIDVATGTTLATLAYDTAEWSDLAVRVWDERAWVAQRTPLHPAWTVVWSGTLTAGGASTDLARVQWGCDHTSGQSVWRLVSVSQRLTRGVGFLQADRIGGRPIGARRVPIPEVGGPYAQAWLHLAGGLGVRDETYQVDPSSRYPLEAIYPTRSRSPSAPWQSEDDSAVVVAWNTTYAHSWQGDAIAIVAVGVNFALATLQRWTGAAWSTVGGLSLTTPGYDYDLVGDVLTPHASTSTLPRFLQENELAGGYAQLGGSSLMRRIRGNTAGAWAAPGSTVTTRIFLESCDGSEPAQDEVSLQWPSGVCVLHRSALTAATGWRLLVPAGQPTDTGKYRAGILTIAPIYALGAPSDWGWSRDVAPNVERSTSRRGVVSTRELGPPIETWTWHWPEGVPLDRHRQGTDLDFVAVGANVPLAALNDVPWRLRGLLERAKSGEVPVVALAALPASGTTITDRTLWLYGGLEGSVRQAHVSGDEGVGELVRVEAITVRSIP